MTFQIVSSRHVTARQRQILAFMGENRTLSAATKTIRASAELQPGGLHKVTFRKAERDDWGRAVERISIAIVRFDAMETA